MGSPCNFSQYHGPPNKDFLEKHLPGFSTLCICATSTCISMFCFGYKTNYMSVWPLRFNDCSLTKNDWVFSFSNSEIINITIVYFDSGQQKHAGLKSHGMFLQKFREGVL